MAMPQKVKATIQNITPYPGSVYHVRFALDSRFTRFKPGQFLHLTLDNFDPSLGIWPESRVFSIASSPRENHVDIVYSVKGVYTKRMEKELCVGKDIWLKLPYGEFIINEQVSSDSVIVLIAGGTGISPYIPFLSNTEDIPGKAIHLFYGVRHTDHLLFSDILSNLDNSDKVHVSAFSEHDAKEGVQQGKLDIDLILKAMKDQSNIKYFLSGPPGMIKTFSSHLETSGVDKTTIYIDSWE